MIKRTIRLMNRTMVLWILAGPGVFAASVAVLAAAPLWTPSGAGGVDHMILPGVLFPAVWIGLFLFTLLDDRKARVAWVLAALTVVNGGAAMLAAMGKI